MAEIRSFKPDWIERWEVGIGAWPSFYQARDQWRYLQNCRGPV